MTVLADWRNCDACTFGFQILPLLAKSPGNNTYALANRRTDGANLRNRLFTTSIKIRAVRLVLLMFSAASDREIRELREPSIPDG